MLRKLLRSEFKATARLFIPLYLVLLVFAIINRLIQPFKILEASNNINIQGALSVISIIIYFILIVGVAVMTFVIAIQRFYKNLLGDEGYLMFTLPVSSWKHIASKLLIAMLWYLLSVITVIASILILVNNANILSELPIIIEGFREIFGFAGFIIFPIFVFVMIASATLMIYNAIALGHLFTKHRLLASFGMYCALYAIYQILLVVIIYALGNTIFVPLINKRNPTSVEMNMFFITLTFIGTLFAAGHFIVTNLILKKRLNLE